MKTTVLVEPAVWLLARTPVLDVTYPCRCRSGRGPCKGGTAKYPCECWGRPDPDAAKLPASCCAKREHQDKQPERIAES